MTLDDFKGKPSGTYYMSKEDFTLIMKSILDSIEGIGIYSGQERINLENDLLKSGELLANTEDGNSYLLKVFTIPDGPKADLTL